MFEQERSRHRETVCQLACGQHQGIVNHSLRHDVQPHILRSWERCLTRYNLDPSQLEKPIRVGDKALADYREPLEDFLFFAQSGMRKLYRMLSSVGYVLLLCNAEGVTIDYVGDPKDEREHRRAGLCPGTVWQESLAGTCGVGTCLEERRAVTIHRNEHFFSPFIGLSCSAAPLYHPDGTLLGALDASLLHSPESKDSQAVALLLVNSHARLIENAYFVRKCRDHWMIRFNKMQAFVEVTTEQIIAVNADGCIVAANFNAISELGRQGGGTPVNRQLSDIFELRIEELVDNALNRTQMVFAIRAVATGIQYFALFSAPGARTVQPARQHGNSDRAAQPKNRPRARLGLNQLAGADPQMRRNATRALRVMNRGIPILLTGETGTGKEVFARAIHESSDRAAKPFIALNCASIPESLIESELFGYRQGAFTGAHIKGMRGKILQADGGTLFLDEIGDMPLSLQTRLLRVLAEKEVLPLGSESPVRVDLNVICATLRNLEELVRDGRFREDLYYRLNGITITLPPLREREDRDMLIRNVLLAERQSGDARISQEAFDALTRHSWPGNIRELHNLIRCALAVSENGIITLDDLPPVKNGGKAVSFLPAASSPRSAAAPLDEYGIMLDMLARYEWNLSRVSRELGISRPTLYKKMKCYAIVPPHPFERKKKN
ncbi:sigma-54-dependent Fis family transcriptional regulator [Pelobacter propionicus]|uniref:GAF modulated sigma54 specific transcriptional regulator, Fis family n=1 Tax=Pelobacter propionicus (strain DSM 2379 / NBRC 103807 / OttBd1) TaxID=338966 RepID=A1ATN2_PELPD|nr:sigma-54-dependent Fis family transcriptional regulator [Pelobacter propionicus]ABL00703.1 GAF modulated sigma54 specific transcriptional regulator, Fis family [Pelobacter propionicus DSM 2379]